MMPPEPTCGERGRCSGSRLQTFDGGLGVGMEMRLSLTLRSRTQEGQDGYDF
jgi:hypothetical protein